MMQDMISVVTLCLWHWESLRKDYLHAIEGLYEEWSNISNQKNYGAQQWSSIVCTSILLKNLIV